MIWGVVALVLIFLLFFLSLTSVIKRTGHEFFRKAHYILAMLYIGACWGHWNQLYCWMLASLVVWGLDRGVRLLRTLLIHTRNLDGSTGMSEPDFVYSELTPNQALNSAPLNQACSTLTTPTEESFVSHSPKTSKPGSQASIFSSASLLSQSGNLTPSPPSLSQHQTPFPSIPTSYVVERVKQAV